MPNPIVIEMLLKGMPDIQAGLRNVEDTIAKMERNSTRMSQRGAKDRQQATNQEAREKVRAITKADAWARQASARGEREAAQRVKAEVRTADRGAREKVRAMERADRDIKRINDRALKETERNERRLTAIRERSATMAGRFAAKQAAEQERASMRWVKKREREQRMEQVEAYHNRRRFIQHVGGAAGYGVQRGLQRAGALAMGVASTVSQLGGGFSIVDSVQRQANLEKDAVGFINAAPDKTGLSASGIQAKAKEASIKTGIEASDVLAAGRAFLSKTGNAQEALSNMGLFGEVATGTGASIEDVAKAAGTLRVQNKGLTPEQMRETLLQVVSQGQKGSIEFADLAGSIGKITKSRAAYAGDQTDTQRRLLGLAQVAIPSAGSSEEAATIVSNISADAMKHASAMTKTLGKGTFNSRGQIAKAPEEFIADVMEKNGGNLQKIQAMGFGARSMKMFQELAPTFNEAVDKKQSGREAVLSRMQDATATPMGYADLQKNVADVMNTSAMQFETSMRQLRDEVGTQLLPELVKLVPVLKEAMPEIKRMLEALIKVAQWAERHPFAGMAALISASILGEVAKAGIGEAFKRGIQAALGPPGVGTGGSGGAMAAGGPSKLGQVVGAVGLAYAGVSATKAVSNIAAGGIFSGQDTASNYAAKLRAYQAGDRDRGMSPQQVQAEIDAAKGRLAKSGSLDQTGNLIGAIFGDDANKASFQQYKSDEQLTDSKELQRQLAETTAALRDLAGATRASGASGQGTSSGPNGAARDQSIVQRN